MMVNDNQVDNYLKEILAFVYNGSIVNNRRHKTLFRLTNMLPRAKFA